MNREGNYDRSAFLYISELYLRLVRDFICNIYFVNMSTCINAIYVEKTFAINANVSSKRSACLSSDPGA